MKITFDNADIIHIDDINSNMHVIAKKVHENPLILCIKDTEKFFVDTNFCNYRLSGPNRTYTNVQELIKDYHKEGYDFWVTEDQSEFEEQVARIFSNQPFKYF